MKNLLLLLITAQFARNVNAQIAIPNGYTEIIYDNEIPGAVEHISNGRYEFSFYPLARDMSSNNKDQSLKEGLEMTFHHTKYTKTSDSLCVGTGQYKSSLYYYSIYVSESWQKISLTSKFNDKQFSENSLWILKQIRQHRKEIYFVN